MTIALVTGDMGFIGQHLAAALHNRGHTVIGLDWKRGAHEDIKWCPLPDADVCFHLAAQTNAQTHNAWADADTNILGTIRILDRYGSSVVFASSIAASNPITPYTISKQAAEHYCRLTKARIVRMCNITGPGGHGVFEAFAKADVLRIAGDGSQRRPYAPVEKAVTMFLTAMADIPGAEWTVEGVSLSVLEIAELFYPEKRREFVAASPYDVKLVEGNSGSAFRDLGP